MSIRVLIYIVILMIYPNALFDSNESNTLGATLMGLARVSDDRRADHGAGGTLC
jgi:hypothetical protein